MNVVSNDAPVVRNGAATTATTDERLRAVAKIRRAVDLLLRVAPFYAEILASWRFAIDESVPTCGVCWTGSWIQFSYTPAFFANPELSAAHAAAVMQHEVHHVLFGHVFWKADASTDRQAQMIAAETVANEFISPQLPLPGNPIRYEGIPGLAPLQSTAVRYELLRGLAPVEPASRSESGNSEPENTDDHSGWPSFAAARTVASVAIAADTERALAKTKDRADPTASRALEAARGGGTDAGDRAGQAVERVDSQQQQAWIDWPSVLAILPPPPEISEETWSRPPRRRPELAGFVPGRQRVPQPPTLLVAIDVSSSMSGVILGRIKSEIRTLASFCRVAVCEIDATLQRAQRLYDDAWLLPGELDDQAFGRGGTAFDAAFQPELLDWAGNGSDLQGILYFTDGFGPEPEQPPQIPVIWILSDEFGRVQVPADFGAVIGPEGGILRLS
jgi:predicted metal-dependent peptidase